MRPALVLVFTDPTTRFLSEGYVSLTDSKPREDGAIAMVSGRGNMEKDSQTYIGRLYERLKVETPGYEWDETDAPFHSVCLFHVDDAYE